MVNGKINDFSFQVALEPDGMESHWFRVDERMRKAVRVDIGDTVGLEVKPSHEWPEPNVPDDVESLSKLIQRPMLFGWILRRWRAGTGSAG